MARQTKQLRFLLAALALATFASLASGAERRAQSIIPPEAFRPVAVTPGIIRDFPVYVSQPRRPVVSLQPPKPKPKPVILTSSHTIADAKAYALAVLGSTQYACLDQIAIHESGWTTPDINPTSGAYGIPQAVPGSKMAWAGADWRTNPVTQVKWMIHYVDGRYGSACGAWSFWRVHRWY